MLCYGYIGSLLATAGQWEHTAPWVQLPQLFLNPFPSDEHSGCLQLLTSVNSPWTTCGLCGNFLGKHPFGKENFRVIGYVSLLAILLQTKFWKSSTHLYLPTSHFPANTWYFPALLCFQCNRCKIKLHCVNLHLGSHQWLWASYYRLVIFVFFLFWNNLFITFTHLPFPE